MPWGAIGAAAIGGLASAFGASKANKQARAAAATQMAFQERMRATQYQTTMADMKAAGLNPILAYKQGGAGTPGGSSFTPINVGGAASTGAQQLATSSSNVSTAKTRKGKLQLEERIGEETLRNLNADTTKKYAEAHNNSALASLHGRGLDKLHTEIEILGEDLQSAKARASMDKSSEEFYNSDLGRTMRRIDLIGRSINPFANSARNITR